MDSADEELKHKKSNLGFQENSHIAYGLRENPKKSWKFSGFENENITTLMQENQCKVCGKEFESMKALYGHMRHHSGRERKRIECKECGKSFLSLKSLTNHARVHSQKLKFANESGTSSSSREDLVLESLYVKRKRSKRRRHKSNASTSFSGLNESLSVSEIDQEVEQVALCLMMLSRGVRNLGELYSFCEFSDNDQAVTFEVKSLNQRKRIMRNDGGDFVSNGNESFKMKKPKEEKLDASVSDSLIVLNEQKKKKDELEVCSDRFYKGGELEMPKLASKSGFVSYDTEIEKKILVEMKFKSTKVESCENSMEEVGLDHAGLGIMKSTSSKLVYFDACDSEFGVDSSNKVKYSTTESETLDNSWKKCEIKCKTCNKIFNSRQALGGHQRMHSTKKGFMAVKIESWEEQNQIGRFPKTEVDCKLVKLESIENLMERETGGVPVKGYESRESKHKCPICFKVFITGQALGGHKRAHLKNSETRPLQIAMSQEHSTICSELDINIPIMLDQEGNGDVGFKQWWVGSNCKHEPLVAN